jgi:hypothetical protein
MTTILGGDQRVGEGVDAGQAGREFVAETVPGGERGRLR